jgi:hypothetical protein
MRLITNGTIDLGNVTSCEKNCGAQQFGIKPNVSISNYKIIDQTAQELVFTMDIPSSAQPGIWTLFVNDASGHEVVALNVQMTAPPPTGVRNLPPGTGCINGQCVSGACVECKKKGGICAEQNGQPICILRWAAVTCGTL